MIDIYFCCFAISVYLFKSSAQSKSTQRSQAKIHPAELLRFSCLAVSKLHCVSWHYTPSCHCKFPKKPGDGKCVLFICLLSISFDCEIMLFWNTINRIRETNWKREGIFARFFSLFCIIVRLWHHFMINRIRESLWRKKKVNVVITCLFWCSRGGQWNFP